MSDQASKLSTRQFFATVWWLFVYNVKLSSFTTIARIITASLLALNPLFNAYIFARLLDGIITIATNGSDINTIIPLLGVLLAYNILNSGMSHFESFLQDAMSHYSNSKSPQLLFSHINTLGIQTLENPEVVNKVQRSTEVIKGLDTDFNRVISLVAQIIILCAASATIIQKMPIMTLVIFASVLPRLASNRYFMRKDWQLWRNQTENRRRAGFISSTLTETTNLQEVSITSAFEYLNAQYKAFIEHYITSAIQNFKRWMTFSFLFNILTQMASMFGYYSIFKNLFLKLISIGDVTFLMRSLDLFASSVRDVSGTFTSLFERCIKVNEVREVFEMKPMIFDGKIELPNQGTAPLISFKNVSFSYPHAEARAIKHLNLEIKPGEKIAIVGENGAGKTTLVKLLCRFYKVSDGAITLDDKNINDLAIASWYNNLGVLFQDYNAYGALTLRENIHLGNSKNELDEARMKSAAEKANINSFIEHYKNGFEQVLSEKFKGGTRPSTGQWQKIAIARFFYRNSPVVIFDEPTASIDAISESEIFGQIYDFFAGKTVIIISHRFSTVRNADRIFVLDNGEIVESGTHTQLMRKRGKYHKAFTIQAKGYK